MKSRSGVGGKWRRKLVPMGALALLALLSAVPALALINPNFTPVHLVEQSKYILLLRFKAADKKGVIKSTVVETLKGKGKHPKAAPVFDFAASHLKADRRDALAWAAATRDGPVLMFVGTGEKGEPLSLVHLNGRWVHLYSEGGIWKSDHVDRQDQGMEGTWAGGTDMLLKLVRVLAKYPDFDVPAATPARLEQDPVKIGAVKGRVADMQMVDLAGDGKATLHVAAAGGDALLRCKVATGGEVVFKRIEADVGLAANSRASAWGDFNGDGRPDLASWDGKGLKLYLQGANGRFTAKEAAGLPEAAALDLLAVDAGAGNRAGLLWAAKDGPVLLAPAKGKETGKFALRRLEAAAQVTAGLKGTATTLVGDIDGDGLADVIQVFVNCSVFFKGAGRGTFKPGVRVKIARGKGVGHASLGDYDMDGRLDVLTVSEDGNGMWHNRGGLKFTDEIERCGEMAYIAGRGGVRSRPCDIDGDGRLDAFFAYGDIPDSGPQIFFNRGFRSFGHAHGVDITEKGLLEAARDGQQCGLVADLDGDGLQDIATVLLKGGIYAFMQKSDPKRTPQGLLVSVRCGKGVAGPLLVTGAEERRCLGARSVRPGLGATLVGLSDPGEVKLTWRLPGGKLKTRKIEIDDKLVKLVLP